jgi:hypothetical protein
MIGVMLEDLMTHLQFALLGYREEPEPSVIVPLMKVWIPQDPPQPVQGKPGCKKTVTENNKISKSLRRNV